VPDQTLAAADWMLVEGELVGEYRIERLIGRGSFGAVYRAVHPIIGKSAAVKLLNRECSANPQTVSRFIAEARVVNQIRHRNIVDIFAFGALPDGRQYHVMELLEGEPLDRYLVKHGPLAPDEALPILERIAKALDAAHAAGVVHRDLKPANVFLAVDDDGLAFPKLLDFGIAKLTGRRGEEAAHRTMTGAPLGTPYYMAPEQARGETVDHRADVYAFGVMAHEMLTGRLPFVDDSVLQVLMKHVAEPPPPMSGDNPALSPELDAPVLWMLEKSPAKRPASLGVAYDGLLQAARIAGHPVPSLAPASVGRPSLGSQRTLSQAPHPDEYAVDSRRATPARAGSVTATQTFRPQTLPSRPPRALLAFMTVLAAATALAALGTFLYFRDRGASPAPRGSLLTPDSLHSASKGTDAPFESVSAAPNTGSASVPRVEPVPSATTTIEPSPMVRWSIHATPPTAEVFRGDELLGSVKDPIALPQGEQPVVLSIRAAGFRRQTIAVTPSKDGEVSVSLSHLPVPAGKRPAGAAPVDDLEF
jgi:serine/threonine-protein kinase